MDSSESESPPVSWLPSFPLPLSGLATVRSVSILYRRFATWQRTKNGGGGLDGVVFAFVKVRDEKVEDGGILLWKVNNLCPCLHEVAAQGPLKVF